MFELSFTPESLKEIVQFAGFSTLLSEEVQGTMRATGEKLAAAAQEKTWEVFANPTGTLASTIQPILESPYEIRIGSDSPYARRREYGFSGMTDSLGRFYAHDPAKPYMGPTLAENEQAILQLMDEAVQRALARMGAV